MSWSGYRPAAEWGLARGFSSALLFLDLDKAFEHIRHDVWLQAAVRTGSPVRHLKLLVELYRCPHVSSLNDAVPNPVCTLQAVPPGCHSATSMLQLV
eukprot:9482234-Pyramimonas_sp.AAC.2